MIRQPNRWDVHCDGVGCGEVLVCEVKSPRAASDAARAAGWEVEGGPLYDHHYCPACAKSMRRKEANADGHAV